MCGHSRLDHQEESEVGHCDACYDGAPEKRLSKAWIHAFVPADAETAGEPDRKAEYERRLAEMCFGTTDEDEEEPECTCGVPGLGDFEGPQGDCPVHGEPEAPECFHESWEVTGEHRSPEGWVKSRVCASCREGLDNIIEAKPHWDIQSAEPEAVVCTHDHWDEAFMCCRDCGFEPEAPEHACKPGATLYYCPTAGELESDCHGGFDVCCSNPEQHVQVSPAPPRPPFLVAYATGSGALMELALPGDATVAVVDGSLVISHASGVLGIQRVRPLEGP